LHSSDQEDAGDSDSDEDDEDGSDSTASPLKVMFKAAQKALGKKSKVTSGVAAPLD